MRGLHIILGMLLCTVANTTAYSDPAVRYFITFLVICMPLFSPLQP